MVLSVGSRYCDGALRTNGFTGEGVYGPSVLAIKSHTINPLFTNMKLPKRVSNTPVFGAAIVLIRNPRNAMVAEWHREKSKRQSNVSVSNHFLYVGEEHFGKFLHAVCLHVVGLVSKLMEKQQLNLSNCYTRSRCPSLHWIPA